MGSFSGKKSFLNYFNGKMGPLSSFPFDEVLFCMTGNKTKQYTHYKIGNVSFVITNGFFFRLTQPVFVPFILPPAIYFF